MQSYNQEHYIIPILYGQGSSRSGFLTKIWLYCGRDICKKVHSVVGVRQRIPRC
uniref:Uncharacterized protein n=1 Tax=Arundo donax TaxID=35708 RepID=A0A0A9HWL2_ARUDO